MAGVCILVIPDYNHAEMDQASVNGSTCSFIGYIEYIYVQQTVTEVVCETSYNRQHIV